MSRETHRYCAYYCEENIWQLAQDAALGPGERHVLLITNEARQALLFRQRAAPGSFVLWDYHVVLLLEGDGGAEVYDLDTELSFPAPLATYLMETFGPQDQVPPELRSRFRLVPAKQFIATFASDRSHMRAKDGGWLHPPPSWPVIDGSGEDRWPLKDAIDLGKPGPGAVLTAGGLLARFGG